VTAPSFNSQATDALQVQLHKQQLRRQLRAQRRALQPSQQLSAARAVARHLLHHSVLLRTHHVACYLAADGELDTGHILRCCWRLGKRVYVPVTQPSGTLIFRRYDKGDKLRRGSFGLLEPLPASPTIAPDQLDLVLLPLVGFTRRGDRLGMGGGYYDRCFADQRSRRHRPQLLGLGHSFQELETLPTLPHDRGMDGFVTERELWLRVNRS
jgi:5-formyltetrahydrofolate cyclo-ligase